MVVKVDPVEDEHHAIFDCASYSYAIDRSFLTCFVEVSQVWGTFSTSRIVIVLPILDLDPTHSVQLATVEWAPNRL